MSEEIQELNSESVDTLVENAMNASQEPSEDESPKILRTSSDGCFEIYESYWGKYIRPCFDPEANVEITKEHLEQFEINSNIHKIPADLWTRWVNLCFHYVDKVTSSVEVSVRILRSEEDSSKYRILVPRQKVSGATVRVDSFEESIDIETGEELTSYPPSGWIPVGSSHSHNTMPAFFSGTDDKYELGDPGIHLVVGSIKPSEKSYTIAASVVGSGRRFTMHFSNLIDSTPIQNVNFHPKVIDYVDYTTPSISKYKPVRTYSYSKGTSTYSGKYFHEKDEKAYTKWLERNANKYIGADDPNDPYYFSEHYYGSSYQDYKEYSNTRYVRLWEIEDLIQDYVKQNDGDFNKLFMLSDLLTQEANNLEQDIFSQYENWNQSDTNDEGVEIEAVEVEVEVSV